MKNLLFALVAVLSVFVIGCNSSETSTESTTDTNTTTAAPTETPAAPAEVTPPADPVQIEATPSTTIAPTGDAKLNPPHGEPGHRCDIAVGAPLPM